MYRVFLSLVVILAGLFVAACSGVEMKPGTQARNNRDIRQGPGVLTGRQGEFVIFRIDKAADEDEADDEDEAGDENASVEEPSP